MMQGLSTLGNNVGYNRRDISRWLIGMACFMAIPARAEVLTLSVLSQIIKDISSVIKSVAEGIEALYKTGIYIIDDQAARDARVALNEVMNANDRLIRGQAPLIWLIENHRLGSQNWGQMKYTLTIVSDILDGCITALDKLSPKLPPGLSSEISRLARLYQARSSIIEMVKDLPKPSTSKEISTLKEVGNNWEKLHKELITLNNQLSKIVK
jgi:hypothetical protein